MASRSSERPCSKNKMKKERVGHSPPKTTTFDLQIHPHTCVCTHKCIHHTQSTQNPHTQRWYLEVVICRRNCEDGTEAAVPIVSGAPMIDTWHAHSSSARIMHQYQTCLLLLEPRVYPRFLVLLHFLAVPEVFWNTTLYLVAMFPSSPVGYKSFLDFSPFIFSNPDNFEDNWFFLGYVPIFFSDIFLMIRLGLWVLERKISEVMCTSSHHTKHTFIPMSRHSEVVVSRMGGTVLSYSSLWRGGTHCSGIGPHTLSPQGQSVCIYLEFCEGAWSVFCIYLFIH